MAHYKRGKCRYQLKHRRFNETFTRKRLGLKPVKLPEFWWKWDQSEFVSPASLFAQRTREQWKTNGYSFLNSWPRWHDIIHHNRPRRAAEKRLEKQVLKGECDLEDVTWPLAKRPHVYYW